MRINPRCIDGTNPCARDRCHGESPILAVGREQLHCVADARLKSLCQARTDDDRAGVVAKVIKVPLNQLVKNIGGLRVQGGIDPVKIDCRVLKCRASIGVSAEHRRTGNDIRKLSAHAHDLIRITDTLKIEAASHVPLGMFCRNHERFVTRPKTRSDYQRAVATNC